MPDQKMKILIAEDDPVLSKAEGFALSSAGFEVDTAKTGKEALQKIKENNYNLILLDLVMPERTGYEVLKDMQLLKNKTPVVVFSNLIENSMQREALELGAKAYCVKANISLDELVEIVKKYIFK